jgi:hypothetical protein
MVKATSALAELDDEVTQRLATLNTVAVAGEELIRDQEIDALASEADEALARLTSARPAIESDREQVLDAIRRPRRSLAGQRNRSSSRHLSKRFGYRAAVPRDIQRPIHGPAHRSSAIEMIS